MLSPDRGGWGPLADKARHFFADLAEAQSGQATVPAAQRLQAGRQPLLGDVRHALVQAAGQAHVARFAHQAQVDVVAAATASRLLAVVASAAVPSGTPTESAAAGGGRHAARGALQELEVIDALRPRHGGEPHPNQVQDPVKAEVGLRLCTQKPSRSPRATRGKAEVITAHWQRLLFFLDNELPCKLLAPKIIRSCCRFKCFIHVCKASQTRNPSVEEF